MLRISVQLTCQGRVEFQRERVNGGRTQATTLRNSMAFSQGVKEQAYRRAGGKCECRRTVCGHSGRCNKSLAGGWHAHHRLSEDAGGSDGRGCLFASACRPILSQPQTTAVVRSSVALAVQVYHKSHIWRAPMAKGFVAITVERCKGCGFCVEFCPTHVLALSSAFNSTGYHPPHVVAADKCSGCDLCGMYCPDFAIFGARYAR